MSVTSEVPASFRSSAIQPGAVGLIRDGIAETLSRRRLISYLVRADVKKKGADTLLGNVWWVVDPLLQMLVYVILVSVIFTRPQPDYPLFVFAAILPWKWFTSVVGDGVSSVTSMERLIKQINFPKLVLPTSAVMAGIVNFAFGLIPLAGLMILFYSDRASPWIFTIPVIALVQLLFSLAGRHHPERRQRVLPGRRQPVAARCSASGSTSRRASTGPSSSTGSPRSRISRARSCSSTRSRCCSRRTAT